ncbi:MAG: hypoxanthine phosphoribosyltransferase [Clostridia bacterium]
MKDNIERILIPYEDIEKRIKELGKEISREYEGKDLLMVGILKGAVLFYADLAKCIDTLLRMDFMAVSSYGSTTVSSGVVRILKDLDESIEGRDVLIVEDIVDTGLTLHYLVKNLQSRNPGSLRICCLLDKPSRRLVDIKPDYIGFEIPDEFVVGYGLDYDEIYRNLRDICILKPDCYS